MLKILSIGGGLLLLLLLLIISRLFGILKKVIVAGFSSVSVVIGQLGRRLLRYLIGFGVFVRLSRLAVFEFVEAVVF